MGRLDVIVRLLIPDVFYDYIDIKPIPKRLGRRNEHIVQTFDD